MKQLYFIRHGQTEWNAIRRMQGQWNSDLSELGRQQADANGQFLQGKGIATLIASPLDRTRQTVELIDAHLKLGYTTDERIKEWHCGDWSGEMWDEIAGKWPEEFSAWRADPFNYRGPGAENYPDMVARAKPFLQQLLASDAGIIGIVSHGMIGRVMVGTLLSMSPDEMLAFSQANDTVFLLTQTADGFAAQHFVGGKGPFEGLPPQEY